MDSYIIRIYRRDSDDTDRITGVVEWSETEERRSFQDSNDLLRILCVQDGKLQADAGEKGD